MSNKADNKKEEKRGSIKIDKDLHTKLKIEAAKKGKTIQELVEEKLKAAS
ncbi:MAG: toxin-antitoxin system HicB family antitoxin [Phaeodactylibacter sp.]|nr:toxin-antitoxin system HicB family antitoxin [Phaeodactylibacter sp.]